jgi:hypothetical protein
VTRKAGKPRRDPQPDPPPLPLEEPATPRNPDTPVWDDDQPTPTRPFDPKRAPDDRGPASPER